MKPTYKPKPNGQIIIYIILLAAAILAMVKLRALGH